MPLSGFPTARSATEQSRKCPATSSSTDATVPSSSSTPRGGPPVAAVVPAMAVAATRAMPPAVVTPATMAAVVPPTVAIRTIPTPPTPITTRTISSIPSTMAWPWDLDTRPSRTTASRVGTCIKLSPVRTPRVVEECLIPIPVATDRRLTPTREVAAEAAATTSPSPDPARVPPVPTFSSTIYPTTSTMPTLPPPSIRSGPSFLPRCTSTEPPASPRALAL